MPDQPEPLTDQQLAEIEDAIPLGYDGPWNVVPAEEGGNWLVGYSTDNPNAGLVATVPDYGFYLADFIARARTDVPALLADNARLRADLTEMTRLHGNALAALYRDDIETDPHLPDLFADGLNGLYEWEDQPEPDQAPQELVDRCVRIIKPAFGKLTQERDRLRAELEQARAADAAVLTVMEHYRDANYSATGSAEPSRWTILGDLAVARSGHVPEAIAATADPCRAEPVHQTGCPGA